jgi:hypothetical protein
MTTGQKEHIMNIPYKIYYNIKKYFYIKKINKKIKNTKYIY